MAASAACREDSVPRAIITRLAMLCRRRWARLWRERSRGRLTFAELGWESALLRLSPPLNEAEPLYFGTCQVLLSASTTARASPVPPPLHKCRRPTPARCESASAPCRTLPCCCGRPPALTEKRNMSWWLWHSDGPGDAGRRLREGRRQLRAARVAGGASLPPAEVCIQRVLRRERRALGTSTGCGADLGVIRECAHNRRAAAARAQAQTLLRARARARAAAATSQSARRARPWLLGCGAAATAGRLPARRAGAAPRAQNSPQAGPGARFLPHGGSHGGGGGRRGRPARGGVRWWSAAAHCSQLPIAHKRPVRDSARSATSSSHPAVSH